MPVVIRSWTALRSTKYSFGRRHNRRMISLRLKTSGRVRNDTFTLKLAFVLTVFLSNLKPACSSHYSDSIHNDLSHNDRNLFSPSSLVGCERLHQNHLTFYFQLYTGFVKNQAYQTQVFSQIFNFALRGCLPKSWPYQAAMFFLLRTCGKNTQVTFV